jgi:hypothetical protein
LLDIYELAHKLISSSLPELQIAHYLISTVSRDISSLLTTTNPFYSEHPFNATTHERHNNLTLVQLVLRASLGDEEGRRVVEWPSICNFILLIHLEIERV